MQDKSVKKLFSKQAKYYADDPSVKESPIVKIFLNWFKNKKIKKTLRICEFGGGGGAILAEIEKLSDFKTELYNAEIISKYRKFQKSKNIKFVTESILKSKFKNNYFDTVIIREVLHHLVGNNLKESYENQTSAIKELKRIIKPDGILIIEELINESYFATKIIYYLSRLNSKVGIRLKKFEISPETIIALFSPDKLEEKVKRIFGKNSIVISKYTSFNEEWRARLTHLGFRSGKVFLVIKKSPRK